MYGYPHQRRKIVQILKAKNKNYEQSNFYNLQQILILEGNVKVKLIPNFLIIVAQFLQSKHTDARNSNNVNNLHFKKERM